MSDYLTSIEARRYEAAILQAIPAAEVIWQQPDHVLLQVRLPNGLTTSIDGMTGDMEGDIADLVALAEGRQP